jgi:hypothetical protein
MTDNLRAEGVGVELDDALDSDMEEGGRAGGGWQPPL